MCIYISTYRYTSHIHQPNETSTDRNGDISTTCSTKKSPRNHKISTAFSAYATYLSLSTQMYTVKGIYFISI